jgi:hypothetical protein
MMTQDEEEKAIQDDNECFMNDPNVREIVLAVFLALMSALIVAGGLIWLLVWL